MTPEAQTGRCRNSNFNRNVLISYVFSLSFHTVHPKKKNRQTCVRKSLICAFAMAFIISVMLIAANQMLRNGME